MNFLKWLLGNNLNSSFNEDFEKFNPLKYESDFEKFKSEIDKDFEENRKRNEDKIKELSSNLVRFGTSSKLDWIEGKDLFDFVSRNWYMNGEQLFEVVNKQTGDRFLAHYYSTENSFVNPLDSDEWFYDRKSDWENQLNDYKAIPVFINYKL